MSPQRAPLWNVEPGLKMPPSCLASSHGASHGACFICYESQPPPPIQSGRASRCRDEGAEVGAAW
jgi:hypothetical protein